MAKIRAETYAFKLTVNSVDGSTSSARKPADARLDGQVTRMALPPLVRQTITRNGGTLGNTRTPRGVEDMDFEFDTPSAHSDCYAFYGRPAELIVYTADALTAPASDGSVAFDREVHTMNGRIDGLARGDISPDGEATTTVTFAVDGEYEIKRKAAGGGSDEIILVVDPGEYKLQTGAAATDNVFENLAAALSA